MTAATPVGMDQSRNRGRDPCAWMIRVVATEGAIHAGNPAVVSMPVAASERRLRARVPLPRDTPTAMQCSNPPSMDSGPRLRRRDRDLRIAGRVFRNDRAPGMKVRGTRPLRLGHPPRYRVGPARRAIPIVSPRGGPGHRKSRQHDPGRPRPTEACPKTVARPVHVITEDGAVARAAACRAHAEARLVDPGRRARPLGRHGGRGPDGRKGTAHTRNLIDKAHLETLGKTTNDFVELLLCLPTSPSAFRHDSAFEFWEGGLSIHGNGSLIGAAGNSGAEAPEYTAAPKLRCKRPMMCHPFDPDVEGGGSRGEPPDRVVQLAGFDVSGGGAFRPSARLGVPARGDVQRPSKWIIFNKLRDIVNKSCNGCGAKIYGLQFCGHASGLCV